MGAIRPITMLLCILLIIATFLPMMETTTLAFANIGDLSIPGVVPGDAKTAFGEGIGRVIVIFAVLTIILCVAQKGIPTIITLLCAAGFCFECNSRVNRQIYVLSNSMTPPTIAYGTYVILALGIALLIAAVFHLVLWRYEKDWRS